MVGIGLGLWNVGQGGSGVATATVSQTDIDQSGSDLSEYTFAALSIGADGGDDVIYIAFGGTSVADATAVLTITVDGVAADEVLQTNYLDGGVFNRMSALYAIDRDDLPDPAQTDVDVVVTLNGGATRAACALLVSPDAVKTPFATASATEAENNLSVNTPSGGIVIASCYITGTGDTWTGLDDTADIIVDGTNLFSTAVASGVTAETPRAISVDAGDDFISAVVASFAPA